VPSSVLQLGSTYLGPASYRLVREETASKYDGIGASLLPSPEGYVVVSLRPGPARSAGIAVGDTIVRIGNTPAAALSASRAMARIMGAPGTSVHLVLRRGRKTLDVRVERAVIHAPAVHARLISFAGRRWGDVHVSVFAIGTSVLLRREIQQLDRRARRASSSTCARTRAAC
jgi:carboxyl-terminal processing protease